MPGPAVRQEAGVPHGGTCAQMIQREEFGAKKKGADHAAPFPRILELLRERQVQVVNGFVDLLGILEPHGGGVDFRILEGEAHRFHAVVVVSE